jgi:hypothetical protein
MTTVGGEFDTTPAPTPRPAHTAKPWFHQSKYALTALTGLVLVTFLCVFTCLKSKSKWDKIKLKLMARSLSKPRAETQMVHKRDDEHNGHDFDPAGGAGRTAAAAAAAAAAAGAGGGGAGKRAGGGPVGVAMRL